MTHAESTIVVHAPADNVYQVWRNFENFPNFMQDVEQVQETLRGRTHWRRSRGPRDAREWDAEITIDEPPRAIAWRSIGNDFRAVQQDASVEFESLGDDTRIHYSVDFEAPAGALDAITSLFTKEEDRVHDDLRRFKEIVESTSYERHTQRIAGVTTSEDEERSVRERYPADTYPPAEGGFSPRDEQRRAPGTNPKYASAKRRTIEKRGRDETPEADRPMDTGTPGGMLGTATYDELTRRPDASSNKTDDRFETDQR
jgi:hypothetical protein